jgi:hypothetical protein
MQFSPARAGFFGCTRFRARPTALALFAIPRSEVGLQYSGPTCPAQVSFAGCVLPSGPSPCTWLSHAQSTMPDKTPQGHPAGFPFDSNPPPPSGFPCRCLGPSIVPCPGFPFRASITAFPTTTFPTGRSPWGFPSSRSYLFLHATACGLRRTFPSSPYRMLLCCLRCTLKPSASATISFRSCTSISGCAVTPAAYRILCVRFAQLLFAGCPAPHWTQHSIRVGG